MKPKSIELLAFDRNHELQYEGKCKLRIDRLSEMLLVEPENEDYKMTSAAFKWNFVMDKNILFIFGEHELSDFALVFDEEKRCKKVYDIICNGKTKNNAEKELLYQRFLIPICKRINGTDNAEISFLKMIMVQWVDNHDGEAREEFIKLFKKWNIFDLVYSKNIKDVNNSEGCHSDVFNEKISATTNKRNCNHRNRKHRDASEPELSNQNVKDFTDNEITKISYNKQKLPKKFSKTIPLSDVKIVNIKSGSRMHRRVLIFASSNKIECYEFVWSTLRKLYYCAGCKIRRKELAAIFDKDENGFECIKMEDKKHDCSPIPYIAGNYIEMKIFKKPNYVILENCNTASGKILIIFDENDKSKCWEFQKHHDESFTCRQCNTPAKLWNRNNEDEYVELKYANHKCKFVPYELNNYYQFNDFVLPPDFEVQRISGLNGKEKLKLVIFDRINRNFCYFYFTKLPNSNHFYCSGCYGKELRVSAKLLQNADGEEYVILSKRKHICELRPYSDVLKKEEIIIRPPDFELLENTENGSPKLFIFDSKDRSLCYTFSSKDGRSGYYCLGCQYIKRYKKHSIKNSCTVAIVFAKLSKDKNGEIYVRMNNNKHICQPKKYKPEKYIATQKCYDYFFFRRNRFPNTICVAIYHPKDKTLCFTLTYGKEQFNFCCFACKKKGKSLVTKIEKDENGKEYFYNNYKKHICEPIKVSSLRMPRISVINRDDIKLELQRQKKLPQEIDEKRIIRFPNFVLQKNERNNSCFLFIFCKNYGYEFYFSKEKRRYRCRRQRCYVTAELFINQNGEKHVIMGKNEHKCEPIKYEKVVKTEEKIVKASDYITISDNSDGKITVVIVFTTGARDECYEFSYHNSTKLFRCLGCKNLNKYISVKLCKDKNGQEYLEMSKHDHICQPRKYIKEKYEPKIIPSELFKFHSNTKGEANKRLVVFTSNKKDLVYDFYEKRKNSYKCLGCVRKKFTLTVRLHEEKDGQKFVQCGPKQHVCEPQKYDPKNMKFKN